MTDSAPEPTIPVACPDCLSDQVKGPDQPGRETYWRCLKCGIVWSPKRVPDRAGLRSSMSGRSTQQRGGGSYWKNR